MTTIEFGIDCAQQDDLHRALCLVDHVLSDEIKLAQNRLEGRRLDAGTERPWREMLRCFVAEDGEAVNERWWAPIAALGLSPAERAIILFAIAPEVSRRAGYQYSMLGDDPSQQWPSVDLLIRTLAWDASTAHEIRSLLQPTAPLFALGVLHSNRTRDTDSSLATTVSPADVVVARLLQLANDAQPAIRVVPARDSDALLGWFDDDVLATLRSIADGGHAVVFARSARPEAAIAAGHHVATHLRRPVVEVDLDQVEAVQHDALIRRAQLLSLLDDGVCVVTGAEVDHRHLLGLARCQTLRPVLAAIGEWTDVAPQVRSLGVLVDLSQPSASTRRRAWMSALARAGHSDSVTAAEINILAQRYEFARDEIDAVVAHASAIHRAVDFHALVSAAGTLAGAVLAGVAERVETVATWRDIVVPDATMAELRHVAVAIRQRDIVMSEYGVGNQDGSSGAAVLFAGPSGTGKTLAASVIARELGADLYRVNLATVVSKYIGETEKNLERVFTAAQRSGAILLFDEADAIFGKRSEVRDAHDRYANLETAYLLQRIEQHHGAVILTTNVRHHLDPAFLRRFAAIVQFPEPSEMERHRLWDVLLGQQAPRAESLDLARLAREASVTGGEIAAVLVDAAAEAADAREPIDHRRIDVAIARLQQRRGR